MNNKLRKSFKLWMGIVIAIIIYYVIHEGTHFIQAILTNNFDSIRIVGLAGIEIMIKDLPRGLSLALFSGLSSLITIVCGYILVIIMPQIFMLSNKMIKIALYYITVILLVLDPIYMSLIHRYVGGGDMNGITKGLGISSLSVSIVFGILAIMNIYIIIKKVHPAYKINFLQTPEVAFKSRRR